MTSVRSATFTASLSYDNGATATVVAPSLEKLGEYIQTGLISRGMRVSITHWRDDRLCRKLVFPGPRLHIKGTSPAKHG